MATIADNIMEMAQLVKSVKRATQLSESSIMKIVELTFYQASQNQTSGRSAYDIPEGVEVPITDEEFAAATDPDLSDEEFVAKFTSTETEEA